MASQPTSTDPTAKPWLNEQETMRARTMGELQRQLDEAQAELRRVSRELRKEQMRHAETAEAYTKTVTNMVEISRENALLSHELDRLRRTAPRQARSRAVDFHGIDLTPGEAKAIRKAMARLHHPDVGGDEQRMKIWNVVLDQLDEAG
ncbi:MAG: hypothetical protein M3R24_01725 [Chloroflexota bacterium]|nr:hypothetical protein [Chloroflexota bacterium]PLS77613.1 MAG: hypothetical protein CYG59_22935 [Chloroflexota bacterium]